MRAKQLIILIFFLFMLPVSYSYSEYTHFGGSEDDFIYEGGAINFPNGTYTFAQFSSYSGGTGYSAILMHDFGNDGRRELITFNNNTISAFVNGNPLKRNATLNLKELSGTVVPYIFDINGDGSDDIIAVSYNSDYVYMIEYDGSVFTNYSSFNWDDTSKHSAGGQAGKVALACKNTDGTPNCIIVFEDQKSNTNGFLTYTIIDEYGTLNTTQVSAGSGNCLPEHPQVIARNWDGLGERYLFNYYAGSQSFMSVDIDPDTNGTTTYRQWTGGEGGGIDCANPNFPNMLVYDVAGSQQGQEIVMASTSKLFLYSLQGSGSTGLLSSVLDNTYYLKWSGAFTLPVQYTYDVAPHNIFLADMRQGTSENYPEFCVSGTVSSQNAFAILCGSEDRFADSWFNQFFAPDQDLYLYSMGDGDFNFTSNDDRYYFTHSTDYANVGIDAVIGFITLTGRYTPNIDEFVTPLGLMRITTKQIWPDYDTLTRDWDAPYNFNSITPLDLQKTSYNDLVATTDENVFYYDDGAQNHLPYINGTVNPCTTGAWKQNTTVEIVTTILDDEGDLGNTRTFLYYGEPTKEKTFNWSVNVTTTGLGVPTTNLYENGANYTGTGVVRIEGRDVEHYNTYVSVNIPFTVASSGFEYGDCVTTFTTKPSDTTGGEGGSETLADGTSVSGNIITQGLDSVLGLTGLGYGILWLIVMIAVAMGFLMIPADGFVKLVGIAFAEVCLLSIGFILGYIGFGVLLTLILISIAVIGLMFSPLIHGSRQ